MKIMTTLVIMTLFLFLGCTPVTLPVTHEYQLDAYSSKQYTSNPKHRTLLVTAPEAVAGYQTAAMLYVKKPFQLETYAKNAWTSPPADMLYPLLVQSLQKSGYFYAVSSGTYTDGAHYRLDTQLLALKQSFLQKPSIIQFSIKVVLTDSVHKQVVASRIINQVIPCPMENPYGGVIAANKASSQMTAAVTEFVVSSLKARNHLLKSPKAIAKK